MPLVAGMFNPASIVPVVAAAFNCACNVPVTKSPVGREYVEIMHLFSN